MFSFEYEKKRSYHLKLTFLDVQPIHWETLIHTRCFKSYNLVAAQPPQVAAYNWDLVPEIGIETATLQFEIIIAINISMTLKASISFLFLSNKTCTSSLFALLEEKWGLNLKQDIRRRYWPLWS